MYEQSDIILGILSYASTIQSPSCFIFTSASSVILSLNRLVADEPNTANTKATPAIMNIIANLLKEILSKLNNKLHDRIIYLNIA